MDPYTPCGAKTRSGHPCKRHPVPGKKRCRLHGGMSTGPKAPATQHGLYSLRLSSAEAAQLPDLEQRADLRGEVGLARLTCQRAIEAGPKAFGGTGVLAIESYFSILDRALGRIARLAEIEARIAFIQQFADQVAGAVEWVKLKKAEEDLAKKEERDTGTRAHGALNLKGVTP